MGACCENDLKEAHNDNLLAPEASIEVHSVLRSADHAKSKKHVSFQKLPGVTVAREPEPEQNG